MKRINLFLLSILLVFASLPHSALANKSSENQSKKGDYETKDEVIYGNLDANGLVEEIYVVNTFRVNEPGQMTDYGKYSSVRNLTNLNDIEKSGDTVQFQAEEEEFYYQGNMKNKPLPWNISINYILDGKEIQPDKLAGKSGALEIQISTSKNNDVDPAFFNNYLLQIALTLDPTKVDNIQAPEGTKANVGQNKQINFTVMPEQSEDYIISADVAHFELAPIEINAAPYSMSIENPDTSGMTKEMQELANAITDVHTGVGDLKSGVADLNQGAQDLSSGSTAYKNGMNELHHSSNGLIDGSTSIKDALTTINESVQANTGQFDVSKLEQLPSNLRKIANGLEASTEAMDKLKQNYSNAKNQLDEVMKGIPSYEISESQIKELTKSNANQKVVNQLVETYRAANRAKQTYQTVSEAFDGVTGALDQSSSTTNEMVKNLRRIASEIEHSLQSIGNLDAMTQLQEGVSSLTSNYQSFHNGLVSYTNGVEDLNTSYQKLDTGIQALANGTASTSEGVNELHVGTKELQEATRNLPGQIEEETEEMMEQYDNADYQPNSFVSHKNKNVEVVQFALQTESIEVPEQEKTEQPEEEKGLWEKFLDLFR